MPLDLSKLNSEQIRPVTSDARFICVTAGAGSGKTRVLTYRYAYLADVKHLRPNNILCITFTVKATNEMKERIEQLLGSEINTVMTLNALGNRILRKSIHYLGWETGFKVIASIKDRVIIIKRLLDEVGPMHRAFTEDISIKKISDFITDRKNNTDYLRYLITGSEADIDEEIAKAQSQKRAIDEKWILVKQETLATFEQIVNDDSPHGGGYPVYGSVEAQEEYLLLLSELIYLNYLKLQLTEKFIDFTDQICLPLMMFEAYPEMLEEWSHQYKHILIDEFQDVSGMNYKLCDKLCGEETSMFVVGDPDQMIYGWRNAATEYMQEFTKSHPNAENYTLTQNYRSGKRIIDAANRLIRNNASRDVSKEMHAVEEAEEGVVKYFHANVSYYSDGKPLWDDEAATVAKRIAELIKEGVKGKDIAVLYRRQVSSVKIKDALAKSKINFIDNREDDTFEYPLSRKLAFLLNLISDEASFSLDEFINLLSSRTEASALRDIWPAPGTSVSFGDFVKQLDVCTEQFPESIRLLRAVSTVKVVSENSHMLLIEEALMLLQHSLIRNELSYYDIFEEVADMGKYLKYLEDTNSNPFQPISSIEGETVNDENSVQLSTIHAAKGLEFDYVFLIDMQSNVMPNAYVYTYTELEEERRIAYVAMTRARKVLWLSESSGNMKKHKPSHFILEAGLEEGLIEQISTPLDENQINLIKALYKRKESRTKAVGWAIAKGLLDKGAEITHFVFGHGKILYITHGGKLVVRFDRCHRQILISDLSALKPVIPEEKLLEYSDFMIEEHLPIEKHEPPKTAKVKEVLRAINEAANDRDEFGKVAVLSIPCGTGKSTAISLKICEVIGAYLSGSHEGMLIMSNTKAQLMDYLNPYDEDVKQYIQDHMEYIVRMDSDNTSEVRPLIKYAPVLIITDQKFFRLDEKETFQNYLTFGDNCIRTLVIMDEEPLVFENYTIGIKELNDMDTGIKRCMLDGKHDDEREFTLDFWNKLKVHIETLLMGLETQARHEAKKIYYSYFLDTANSDAAIYQLDKDPTNPVNRFYRIIRKNKFLIQGNADNLGFDVADCVFRLTLLNFSGLLYEFSNGTFPLPRYSRFVVRRKNDIYFLNGRDLKFVVLDGTADISPAYRTNSRFVLADCRRFKRNLNNLRIIIYDQSASKASLKNQESFSEVLKLIKHDIASQIPKDEKWALFTPRESEKPLAAALSDYNVVTGHFGNLRGKNIYNDLKHIVQVGVFRYPLTYYFTYEVEKTDRVLKKKLQQMAKEGQSTHEEISKHIADSTGYTKYCMDMLLLCDIEQNLFRGIIRSDNETPYTFHLILSYREYSKLINAIKIRYGGSGAQVIVKYNQNKNTNETAFFQWHDGLPDGTLFKKEDVLQAIGSPNLRTLADFYKSSSTVEAILTKERIGQGTYCKKSYAKFDVSDLYNKDCPHSSI